MSMIFCPECAHEVSVNAVACPNCGRPMQAPPVERKVIVATPPHRAKAFPTWAFVAIGLLAAMLLVVVYLFVRESDEGNTNVNLRVSGSRNGANDSTRDVRTTTVPSSDTSAATVPDQSVTVPGQSTSVPSTSTSAPVAPPPDTGTVTISARVQPTRGSAQSANNTKFYLLDKDVESILSEADVEPIEGNTLTASIGLAAVFPNRYGAFQRAAQNAIARHVKYSGTTDGSGKTSLANVQPDSYYIFAIKPVGSGFALWNQSVSVIAGSNMLEISPQPVTAVSAADPY